MTGTPEPAVAARHAKAYAHAAGTDGIAPKDYDRFCQAAELAHKAIDKTLVAVGCKGNLKAARMRRRQLVAAAMAANGVPWWIRLMGGLAPWPYSVVIAAILWTIDTYLEAQ